MLVWDFNWSFGQEWRTEREAPDDGRVSTHNRLFDRLLDSPRFGPPLRARLVDALRGPLALEHTLPLVDAYAAEIEAASARDDRRWGADHEAYFEVAGKRQDFLSPPEERAYVRSWIEGRWAYLLAKFSR